MIAADTNILVRYLTQDDEVQSKIAEELLDKHSNETIFINNIAICELIWVLERGYKYSKEQITTVIRQILSTQEFTFERQDLLWIALEQYSQNKGDFSDALIAEINQTYNCSTTFTFDKRASQLKGFSLC